MSVATLVLLDDQVPPLTEDVKVVVPFEHNEVVPISVPALGGAAKVNVLVAVALAHPPVPKTV